MENKAIGLIPVVFFSEEIIMNRTEAIYEVAKRYAKLCQCKPEFRKALSVLQSTDVYTDTEYQFILGYVYKTLGLIKQNAYKLSL